MKLEVPQVLKPDTIILIGDVHGFTSAYQKLIKKLPVGQRSIQLGDMGLGFEGVDLDQLADTHTWFRGNHDNPVKCRLHPNYRGDYGYDSETGIFHLAGAWSIDRAYRTEGRTWWADEELNYAELDEAVKMYRTVKPRFVVSHEAPVRAVRVLLSNLKGPYFAAKLQDVNTRTSQALQVMLEYHQPDKWVFGHYHVDKEFYVPEITTKFICVGGMMSFGEPPHTYDLKVT
jgi:hypothetical protein